MQELVMATSNAHKAAEIASMLEGRVRIKTLQDIKCFEDIPETGDTFSQNALQKAQYIWDKFQVNCFADDSGLEVEALGGQPGIFSARFAGLPRSDKKNNELLLEKLAGEENRRARFKCVIALILRGQPLFFEGIVEGQIRMEPSGQDGFGYDPLFQPDGYLTTFSEMPVEEKNRISHRGIAVEKMKSYLAAPSKY